jgi:WD40 repeat protein
MAAVKPLPPSKRQRHHEHESSAVALYVPPSDGDHDPNSIRTSSLASPTMKLAGHKGSVYCLAYDPLGEVLCSGSFDSTCLLWNGECLSMLLLMTDDSFLHMRI